MPTANTATSEIETNTNLLLAHLLAEQTYLSSSFGTPPELQDLSESLKYDEQVVLSNLNAPASQSLNMGALSDSIYSAAAIIRDAVITYQTKADIYTREDLSLDFRKTEISERLGWISNLIRGSTPDQKGLFS